MRNENAPVSGDQQILEMMNPEIVSSLPAMNVTHENPVPQPACVAPASAANAPKTLFAIPEQSISMLSVINVLCGETRRPSRHQPSWNFALIKVSSELEKRLPQLLKFFNRKGDQTNRASGYLSKMAKSLKAAKSVKPSQQRKWNDRALDALNHLIKAHRTIGSSNLKRCNVDVKLFDQLSGHLKSAKQASQRSAKGLRRHLGNLTIDQRIINKEIFKIIEKIHKLHQQLGKIIEKNQIEIRARDSWTATSRYSDNVASGLVAGIGVRLQEVHAECLNSQSELRSNLDELRGKNTELAELLYSARTEVAHLRESVRGNHEQTVGMFMRQVREGNFFGIPHGLLAECAATSNYLNGWQGPLAGSGVWFNEPVVTCNDPLLRGVWICTSERVVERYWVMSRLYQIPQGARILDAGCSESTLSIELASSGYSVTAVDQRHYSLHHPSLHVMTCDLCRLPFADASYDVVIFLSTIEHLGIGHYGDEAKEGKDVLAMREARRVLKPGGVLLMTTPYGIRNQNDVHRIYDAEGLANLLDGFKVVERGFAIRKDKLVWERCDDESRAALQPMTEEGWAAAVALISAVKSDKP